jgi:CheY-like chemotaxis protein
VKIVAPSCTTAVAAPSRRRGAAGRRHYGRRDAGATRSGEVEEKDLGCLRGDDRERRLVLDRGGTSVRDTLADLSGVSVLVVDDNHDARKLLTTVLQRSDANVDSAHNVAAALAFLDTSTPDVVISDIEMTGEDGYSFRHKLRLRDTPVGHVPVIALTAYAQRRPRARALGAVPVAHAKAVEPIELTEA